MNASRFPEHTYMYGRMYACTYIYTLFGTVICSKQHGYGRLPRSLYRVHSTHTCLFKCAYTRTMSLEPNAYTLSSNLHAFMHRLTMRACLLPHAYIYVCIYTYFYIYMYQSAFNTSSPSLHNFHFGGTFIYIST